MPNVMLQHCVTVTIYDPSLPPHPVVLELTVGGAPGHGTVEVTAGAGELPGPLSVTTASSGTYALAGVTVLMLHYTKAAGGPDSVRVSYEVV